VINLFIPSGSGQAVITMPIIIPLADIAGITRQVAALASQLGDGSQLVQQAFLVLGFIKMSY